MKRWKLAVLIVGLLSFVGCGDGMRSTNPKDGSTTTIVPYVPNPWTVGPGGNNLPNGGASTQLYTTAAQLQDYAGHPVYSADNVTISIQLSNFSNQNFSGHYSGYATISYNNGGTSISHSLWTGSTDNDTQYNVWYNDPATNKRIFHAFFEDEPPMTFPATSASGGLILVIDQAQSLGDGTVPTTLGGSIWYKNYSTLAAYPKPSTMCWFISLGPYDCQAWLAPHYTVDPRKAIYPDNGYRQLGTFTGLSSQGAFNIQ